MRRKLIIAICIVLMFSTIVVVANNDEEKVYYIGYCEGESYYEFDYALNYIILGLQEYGLIGELSEELPIETKSSDTWELLKKQDQSDWKVKFVPSAYFSLTDDKYYNMSDNEIIKEISKNANKENVDIMLSLGTTASLTTKQIKSDKLCRTICVAAADPVASAIVEGSEKSNLENVWAVIDTNAFKRSIMVMEDIFAPKTVGIVYANNDDAYIYSGAKDLDAYAKENELIIKSCFVDDPETYSDEDMSKYYKKLENAFTKLSKEVDVFIMTTSLIDGNEMKNLFTPFYKNRVPIYSINSTDDVKNGALMAAESSDYKNIGRFVADTINRNMEGESLAKLPQVYETAPLLVINYETARKIGYKPSFNMLLSANEIYIKDKDEK